MRIDYRLFKIVWASIDSIYFKRYPIELSAKHQSIKVTVSCKYSHFNKLKEHNLDRLSSHYNMATTLSKIARNHESSSDDDLRFLRVSSMSAA